jgi:hypothetical protein
MDSDFDKLAQLIADKCFHGALPPYPEIIRDSAMECVECLREADRAHRQYIAEHLLTALTERITAQSVAADSQFKN